MTPLFPLNYIKKAVPTGAAAPSALAKPRDASPLAELAAFERLLWPSLGTCGVLTETGIAENGVTETGVLTRTKEVGDGQTPGC